MCNCTSNQQCLCFGPNQKQRWQWQEEACTIAHQQPDMPNFMIKEQVTLQSSEDTNKVGAFPTKKIGSMRMATHPTNLHSEIDLICIVHNLSLLSTELSLHAAIVGTGYPIFCPTQKSNSHVTTIPVSQLIKVTCISRRKNWKWKHTIDSLHGTTYNMLSGNIIYMPSRSSRAKNFICIREKMQRILKVQ